MKGMKHSMEVNLLIEGILSLDMGHMVMKRMTRLLFWGNKFGGTFNC
ncbi:hypothetical protein Hdeb2414_s0145g00813051 [Helianthus debilis subsp. tardiflorus]